ncbi:CRISPR-associated ring nuclease Csm6 [Azovibrio restrictus]|uniref:CRISPR-associated ring nuclease Csm6 n=1 Tax=Azovibrio restrictus TaxID=146938 RepID=UPI0026ECC275|nr:CRISPR-associated ring nuclease Csm6 [Azovibrio restrictus]
MPNKILLAVTGLSPQIVTETLYALCVQQFPAWIPDQVLLITSKEGAERARLALLDPEAGQFHAFCRDYPQARHIRFDLTDIHTIRDSSGRPMTDIRTPGDNARAADAIHALIRNLTADEHNELHVSIAGGRKTMGFYLGYCLSLMARPQDRLSHVLVSDPFESLPDFYYPPAQPRVLHTREGRPIHTADAQIMLAEIPFVRLRPLLPASILSQEQSFSSTVAAMQSHLVPPRLVFNLSRRTLLCGQQTLTLPPQLLAWHLWLAERRRRGAPPIRFTDADPAEFLATYSRIVGHDSADLEQTAHLFAQEQGIPKEFFEQKCAKLNRALKTALGLAAPPYLITAQGRRPLTRYGLTLSPEQIEIHADSNVQTQ